MIVWILSWLAIIITIGLYVSGLVQFVMIVWILSWLAIILTIGFFLSGMFTCRIMFVKKSTNNIPFLPFLTTFMNCILWCTYGIMKEDSTLIIVNSVGATLQVLYMLCFLYFSKETTSELRFITYVGIAGCMVYYYMMNMLTEDTKRTAHLGKICTVVTIMMQASPLATMATVIRTKSTESMQFTFSFLLTLVSLVWLFYGMAIHDLNIQNMLTRTEAFLLPNGNGVILGFLQLSLFCIYPSKSSSSKTDVV